MRQPLSLRHSQPRAALPRAALPEHALFRARHFYAGGAPKRHSRGPLAPYAALAASVPRAAFTAASDAPVRPFCAGERRAPDLAFPANAATSAAKVAKCPARLNSVLLNLRLELELELIQPHMAQKPVLRGEVGCALTSLVVPYLSKIDELFSRLKP